MRKCHVSTDPKKGKGQPTQDQEKWNLRQRNNRTKTLQQTMPWMTRESWPRDQGEQAGPGEQEARVLTDNSVQREGVKGQLTLELVNEKTLHFDRNLY